MNNLLPYRFEPLSRENIHRLIPLFYQVFGKKVSENFLAGKYNTFHVGPSFLGYLAFLKNTPVAFSGFVPAKIRFRNILETGAQSVDSMCLEEHRNKGLFSEIYKLNENILKQAGVNFAYGFANQYSEPAFINKLGWSFKYRMKAFIIPVNNSGFNKILWKTGLNSVNSKLRRLKPVLMDETFENPLASNENASTVHDIDFFKYKTFQAHQFIQINGIKIWIKIGETLSVGSISKCSHAQFFDAIQSLIKIGKETGASKIVLQYSHPSQQASMLSEKYEPIEGSAIIYKPYNTQVPLEKLAFSYADIDTF